MKDTGSSLLVLVRLGIHPTLALPVEPLFVSDWEEVYKMAITHGVAAIAFDGYSRLYNSGMIHNDMELNLKRQWLGNMIQSELNYKRYEEVIGHLASFYRKENIRMMILKGYGLSLNYPNPTHRPCGDVDIWTFNENRRADRVLHERLGIEIDNTHHRHTVFHFEDQMFENHYDFVNTHSHSSNKVVELRLKELVSDGFETIFIDSNPIFIPSPNFNAIFLLRHTAAHFAASQMSIRQLLDWGFFVQRYHDKVDWNWIISLLSEVGSLSFFRIINGICVDQLGFSKDYFPKDRDILQERVLNDLFEPEFKAIVPAGFISSLVWRYNRWHSNAWKHHLVYPESMNKTFFAQLWTHVLKPHSFKL